MAKWPGICSNWCHSLKVHTPVYYLAAVRSPQNNCNYPVHYNIHSHNCHSNYLGYSHVAAHKYRRFYFAAAANPGHRYTSHPSMCHWCSVRGTTVAGNLLLLAHIAGPVSWQNLRCTHSALQQCICHWCNHSYKRPYNVCRCPRSPHSKSVSFLQPIPRERVKSLVMNIFWKNKFFFFFRFFIFKKRQPFLVLYKYVFQLGLELKQRVKVKLFLFETF